MECAQARVELTVYALGALDRAGREAVERHLAGCPACLAETLGHADLVDLMGTVEPWEIEPRPDGPP